ncbi:unnamed protein product [Alopecurus aequalis]
MAWWRICSLLKMVRVELDHPPPHFLVKEEGYEASSEESEDYSEDESEDVSEDEREDETEDHGLDYEGVIPVFTKGLKLTVAQTEEMNNRIGMSGFGMGAFFVHKLTESDVSAVGVHIPKRVVFALKIKRRGWSVLQIGDSELKHAAFFYTSTDGRLRFKNGWVKFVEKFDLEVGLVVLVMFHMDNNGYVNISFDVM